MDGKILEIKKILNEINKIKSQRKDLPIKCDMNSREYIKFLEKKIEEIEQLL